MKNAAIVVVGLFALLGGCGGNAMTKWIEGGLYSTRNEEGTYSVLKILKVDGEGVHIRLYSNQFLERPTDVDEDTLYMAGVDREPDAVLGIGHLPLSKQSFTGWDAQFIKAVPVEEGELEGYEMWLEAEGGYF
jgi:hypothetical protein